MVRVSSACSVHLHVCLIIHCDREMFFSMVLGIIDEDDTGMTLYVKLSVFCLANFYILVFTMHCCLIDVCVYVCTEKSSYKLVLLNFFHTFN